MDLHGDEDSKNHETSDVLKSSTQEETGNSEFNFTTKTWKEDFCFIVEDKRLYVARNIIALASPLFERMFEAENEKVEMELPGKKFEDVKEFLNCIYPNVMKAVTIKNAFQIVALAEEYQVAALKAKCEACFLRSISTEQPAAALYGLIDLACHYSLDELFYKCITLAADKSLSDLEEAENQTPIPPMAKVAIQREIIKKMEATQVKTNRMAGNLNTELQRMTTLYQYHHACTPKNDRLSSDDFKGWRGTTLFAKIDTNKYIPILNECKHKFMLEICGTQIKLEFKLANRNFRLVLSAPEMVLKKSTIKLVGSVVVVNGLNRKEDFRKKIDVQLCSYSTSIETSILAEAAIFSDEGYIYHGEIDVQVYLLAQKTDVK